MESAALKLLPRQRIEANARARSAEGRGANRPAGDEASHQAAALRTPRIDLTLTRARSYSARDGSRSRGRDTGGGPAHLTRTSPTRPLFPSTWVGNCKKNCAEV